MLRENGRDFFTSRVPPWLYPNLREGIGKRLYQMEAFGRFDYFWKELNEPIGREPRQLLFHMATGSGKTMIMAGLMLYLYREGYRNFLFFVNSTNIIDKTRDNFLNPGCLKYLFGETIQLNGRLVRIREVENFQTSHPDDINLVFSTIQGLHVRLNQPRENSLTIEDFQKEKIVLISDEAHHINADTKKNINRLPVQNDFEQLNALEKEMVSWEQSVKKILHAHPDNILLDFTATIDMNNPLIRDKYAGKMLFDYSLKQFRRDGYSKEVKVLQSDLSPFERALQGVLLSQYRQKVFEKNGHFIKPVILFKNKTIKESQDFYREFISGINSLNAYALQKIKSARQGTELKSFFLFLEKEGISLQDLVLELREDFSPSRLMVVNSRQDSESKQLALNSLEDPDNPYRGIFAVDKLNEGWDVLNLFDIVRLYETRHNPGSKPAATTMSEAQLIGRGARYCPFHEAEGLPADKRKYDGEPGNELRIGEVLYYHSPTNPSYIRELNTVLVNIGIKPSHPSKKKKQAGGLKKSPEAKKEKNFVENGLMGRYPALKNFQPRIRARSSFSSEHQLMSPSMDKQEPEKTISLPLPAFGEPLIRKAMNRLPFYRFSNLKNFLPCLNRVSEFIHSRDYLGSFRVNITLPETMEEKDLNQDQKLEVLINFLGQLAAILSAEE